MSLSSKDPLEKVVITFDFTAIPETISNPVITITIKGDDANISSMLIDVPQITGNKILQLVSGGEDGTQYTVRCLVDVALTGERFMAKDTLTVKS